MGHKYLDHYYSGSLIKYKVIDLNYHLSFRRKKSQACFEKPKNYEKPNKKK